jgi:hypothetical protein
MPPRVLFGARTSDGRAMSDMRPMRDHLLEAGRPVHHATVEAADGASCLRFARTVIFTHGVVPQLPGAGELALFPLHVAFGGLGDGGRAEPCGLG